MRVYGLPMFDRITGNYVLFVFNISFTQLSRLCGSHCG